jgi:hypothetical protein
MSSGLDAIAVLRPIPEVAYTATILRHHHLTRTFHCSADQALNSRNSYGRKRE